MERASENTRDLFPGFIRSFNIEILNVRQSKLDQIEGPKVGDYIRTLDGELLRFTIDNGDSLQAFYGGSFYLSQSGCDFSGTCGESFKKYKLVETGERRKGPVWFFSNGEVKAHNGYYTDAEFSIWEEIDDNHLTDSQWKHRSITATKAMKSAAKTFGVDSVLLSAIYLPRNKFPEHYNQ